MVWLEIPVSQRERPYPSAWLLSFTPRGAESSEAALIESATAVGGLSGVLRWHPERLRQLDVFKHRRHLLEKFAVTGLGLWKPAVILEELHRRPVGDVILYHDVGKGYWGDHAFHSGVTPIIDWAIAVNGGIFPGTWLPEDGRNARWTPRDCFCRMDCDEERFWVTPQVQTTYSVWQHNDRALNLLEAWLAACIAVYDDATATQQMANFGDFIADRGSQSILTNLVVGRRIASFGRPSETTVELNHPSFAPIPATDIGNMIARIVGERKIAINGPCAEADEVRSNGVAAGAPPAGALFTSVPPRIKRISPDGVDIGQAYQEECIRSWLANGFTVYSIHFKDELETIERFNGLTYVGVDREDDDPPDERKPSLKTMLRVADERGARLSGFINADILLLRPPGWTDIVLREVKDSVVVFTRYETNDVDRTCIGWAPWGFDLIFFDRQFIKSLQYCQLRIGETWWDYWFPLWMYFSGAEIKHVEDCIALHLDHEMVSITKVQSYGLRFLSLLTQEAEAQKRRHENTRLTRFYDYCLHRFAVDAQRLGITDRNSYEFVTQILNPTVWAGIRSLLRRHHLEVVAKNDPHHVFLSSLVLRSAQYADRLRNRLLWTELGLQSARERAAAVAQSASHAPDKLVIQANTILSTWPYRFDFWLGNVVRQFRGKPLKPERSVITRSEAIVLFEELQRRVVWTALAPLRSASLHRYADDRSTVGRRGAADTGS
jgi:hypothetical protein